MKMYQIKIQELLERIVEVEAKSSNDAISQVVEKYRKTEIVLDYNDFVDVDFIDVNIQRRDNEKDMLVREIIEYLYDGEKTHFEELTKPNNHIFSKLKKLENLID